MRAIFDNAGFMVKGEEVRVGGATVGKIESVDVTMPGEVDSYKNGELQAVPGKAVIVMQIEDPGFQDFRSDASCYIRPQSLIGEKFVDCRPTLSARPGLASSRRDWTKSRTDSRAPASCCCRWRTTAPASTRT